ncbi:MAG: DUF1365 domain-containing protein [Luteimonas sp.]
MQHRNAIDATGLSAATIGNSDSARVATGCKSAIYEGWVRHRRHAPRPHAFRYRICMLYIDLAEADNLFAQHRLWSVDRANIAEFRRADFMGDTDVPLDTAVRDKVQSKTGHRPAGPIRLLAHLRYFGYSFNPVSVYYCFADDGVTLDTIVAEITNTPWKQRHAYVLPVAGAEPHGRVHGWRFDKRFHVSPFMPMERQYDWRFSAPDSELHVNMDVFDGDLKNFDATLVLQRRAWSGFNLARVLFRYPLMTLQVVAAIHWQALRLWLRGNPIHDHPDPPRKRDHGIPP